MARIKRPKKGCERLGAAALRFCTSAALCSLSLAACESTERVGQDAAPTPAPHDASAPRPDASDAKVSDDAQSPHDAGSDASTDNGKGDAETARERDCNPTFEAAGVLDLDAEGRSAPIELAFGQVVSQVAIVVEPDGTGATDACYGLEEVSAGDDVWVAQGSDDTQDTCLGCAQPVRLHPDQGYFVLPSASSVTPFATLSLRVAMRECSTQTRPSAVFPLSAPKRVRVRYRVLNAHAPAQKLALSVGLVVAAPSLLALPEAERSAFTAGVRTSVQTALAAADIEVSFHEGTLTLPPPKVEWKPEDRTELDALFTSARAALGPDGSASVPLVLAPCLERRSILGVSRPLGTAPHLPGACHVPYAGVYAAAESCLGGGLAFSDGAALGVIAAHELGHYLGLFHVDESVLFPDDRQAGEENLMQVNPVASLSLTPQQIVVLRRHPDLSPKTTP